MTRADSPDTTMTYVGRNPCGCVGVLIVDAPEDREQTAKRVAQALRDGLAIERVPTAAIHSGEVHLRPCSDNPACVRTRGTPTATQQNLL